MSDWRTEATLGKRQRNFERRLYEIIDRLPGYDCRVDAPHGSFTERDAEWLVKHFLQPLIAGEQVSLRLAAERNGRIPRRELQFHMAVDYALRQRAKEKSVLKNVARDWKVKPDTLKSIVKRRKRDALNGLWFLNNDNVQRRMVKFHRQQYLKQRVKK